MDGDGRQTNDLHQGKRTLWNRFFRVFYCDMLSIVRKQRWEKCFDQTWACPGAPCGEPLASTAPNVQGFALPLPKPPVGSAVHTDHETDF